MSEAVETAILAELRAVRDRLSQVGEEVSGLRNDVAQLKSVLSVELAEADPVMAIRRLWDEGLSSGIAGDLDEVFDEVLAALPRSRTV